MMKHLQKLGKIITLPVVVLPVTATMTGIGYVTCPATMQDGDVAGIVQTVGFALVKTGSTVIDKLPMLFAVGIAIGLSEGQHGTADLVDLVAFLIIITALSNGVVATMMSVEEAPLTLSRIDNAFIGITSSATASICYNRFSSAQLPTALAFFSRKRCVPIVISLVMVTESVILYSVWPMPFNAFVWVGEQIVGLGLVGAGLYTFANRLLTPAGLHHALNAVSWLGIAGTADTNKLWSFAEGGIKGITGMYQVGFSPVTMFGLPATAFAIYQITGPKKKQYAAGTLIAGTVAFFVSGVTEPLELSFMLLVPGLYLIHAVLTGISVAIAAAFHWTASFCFSAGITDFIFSYRLPMVNQPFMLLVQGVISVIIYYVVLCAIITKPDLSAPGREKEDLDAEMTAVLVNDDSTKVIAIVLKELGGKGNVVLLDNRVTGLGLEVKDHTLVNGKKVRSTGVVGVMRLSRTSVQVVVGTKVQFVVDEIQKMLQ